MIGCLFQKIEGGLVRKGVGGCGNRDWICSLYFWKVWWYLYVVLFFFQDEVLRLSFKVCVRSVKEQIDAQYLNEELFKA